MAARSDSDLPKLDAIDSELAQPGLGLSFKDATLEHQYRAEQRAIFRRQNWITIGLTALVFDLFILSEMQAAPELVPLSAVLRFAILTPAVAAYILLDWRRKIERWVNLVVTGLLILPTVLVTIEAPFVTSATELGNYQAVPLIQLAVLTNRLNVRQACACSAVSCLMFLGIVAFAPFIPAAIAPSMSLADIAICISVVVFATRTELRERQLFLLHRQSEIRRDLLMRQNRALARLTQIDALTGLGNRRLFDDALAALWADSRRKQGSVTLLMFDIDHFKRFNDSFGHQAGDDCLVLLAQAMRQGIRGEEDTLARYGGEEFAIILPDTSLEDGQLVAERVRAAVAERRIPHPCVDPTPYVTISLGVATASPLRHAPAGLIEAADRCLYAAKRAGRNCVVCHDLDDSDPALDTGWVTSTLLEQTRADRPMPV